MNIIGRLAVSIMLQVIFLRWEEVEEQLLPIAKFCSVVKTKQFTLAASARTSKAQMESTLQDISWVKCTKQLNSFCEEKGQNLHDRDNFIQNFSHKQLHAVSSMQSKFFVQKNNILQQINYSMNNKKVT